MIYYYIRRHISPFGDGRPFQSLHKVEGTAYVYIFRASDARMVTIHNNLYTIVEFDSSMPRPIWMIVESNLLIIVMSLESKPSLLYM